MQKALLLIALLFVSTIIYAADQPASEASVKKLIEITQSKQLIDNMQTQMDSMMRSTMKKMIGNKTLSPEQEAIIEDMQKQIVTAFASDMNWETLEPDFIDIYRKSFTEDEVTGMLDFYRTPAGQAVIKKMPVVMKYSMEMMQNRMIAVMPKIQQIQKEAIEKLKATRPEGH